MRRMAPAESPTGSDTKTRLLEATKRCLMHQGISKTGVVDIVREAGVSRPLAYRYFEGRDDLIQQALGSATRAFVKRMSAVVTKSQDPLDILVEGMIYVFLELPKDPVLSQALGVGELATLSNYNSADEQGVTSARFSLRGYKSRLPNLPAEEMDALAELVNRIIVGALIYSEYDPLMKSEEEARRKLRLWLGPIVAHHINLNQELVPKAIGS